MALANNDGSENEDKLNNLYRALADLDLVADHNEDDRINFRIFLTICRDIFGLNTFEIDDTIEDVELGPSAKELAALEEEKRLIAEMERLEAEAA